LVEDAGGGHNRGSYDSMITGGGGRSYLRLLWLDTEQKIRAIIIEWYYCIKTKICRVSLEINQDSNITHWLMFRDVVSRWMSRSRDVIFKCLGLVSSLLELILVRLDLCLQMSQSHLSLVSLGWTSRRHVSSIVSSRSRDFNVSGTCAKLSKFWNATCICEWSNHIIRKHWFVKVMKTQEKS